MSQPDESFTGQVHDILAHLYDNSYLQSHALAEQLAPNNRFSPRERLRFLRTTVLEAIEELNPGAGIPLRELRARSYNILSLHYVEGMAVTEVATQLAISERQVYRDLRKAEQDLAALLWARRRGAPDGAQGPARAELVREEAGRLASRAEPVDLRGVLDGALSAVALLGQKCGVRIEAEAGAGDIVVHADRSLARQALISALSGIVQNAQANTAVTVLARPGDMGAEVEVRYTPAPGAPGEPALPVAAQQLIRCLGASWAVEARPGGQAALILHVGQPAQKRVLVIDDNAGLWDLFRRYLADQPYQLLAAQNGAEGLRLAAEQQPDIVVLDVMMPERDGWEVLQLLRSDGKTRSIPVIVCSVLDDPQLALALGAVEYLAKPVSRTHLLQALARHR